MSSKEDLWGKGTGGQSCPWMVSDLLQLKHMGVGTEVIKIIYLKGGYIIGIFLRLLGKLIMPFIVTRIFQIQF